MLFDKHYNSTHQRVVNAKSILDFGEINSNGGFSFVKNFWMDARTKAWGAELPTARNSCHLTSVIVRGTIGLMAAGNSNYAGCN